MAQGSLYGKLKKNLRGQNGQGVDFLESHDSHDCLESHVTKESKYIT